VVCTSASYIIHIETHLPRYHRSRKMLRHPPCNRRALPSYRAVRGNRIGQHHNFTPSSVSYSRAGILLEQGLEARCSVFCLRRTSR